MDRIDSRSYPAIIVFGIGLALTFIANFVLKDAHVTTVTEALTRLTNGESKDILLLWVCALFGVSLEAYGTVMMGKLSWENIKYYSYETNAALSVIITIIMTLVTIISTYYTSKVVMGIIILVAVFLLWASSYNTQHSNKRRY